MFDLSGKNALVTGASGGIGDAIARVLHGAGANVAISGTREEKLSSLAASLGSGSHPVACDLSDKAAVGDLVKRSVDAMGSVDILVNNAGITRDNLFIRMSDGDWMDVLDVNLSAAMLLCRGVLRGMMKARWGRIINITSVVGSTGNPGQANYAAAKAGMVGMSKSLAAEMSPRGITVNCIAPGFIETEMTGRLTKEQRERILAQVPSRRMGTGQEVASAVLFLAAEESGYITGQTIHVNGGLAMI